MDSAMNKESAVELNDEVVNPVHDDAVEYENGSENGSEDDTDEA